MKHNSTAARIAASDVAAREVTIVAEKGEQTSSAWQVSVNAAALRTRTQVSDHTNQKRDRFLRRH